MGTWAAGPFGNDAAMDFVGDVIDSLMIPVKEFVEAPAIDETFDPAFAAISLLNGVMERTNARPWSGGAVVDGGPIRQELLRCFDDQIDELEPDDEYKRDQRAALVETLDRFVALLADES